MINKSNSILSIFLTLILTTILTSCHFGFPDCEDDGNLDLLKSRINGGGLDSETVKISNIKETGLSDAGSGSDSFTCHCRADYQMNSRRGTIRYSVTREKSSYTTRILRGENKELSHAGVTETSKEKFVNIIDSNAVELLDFRFMYNPFIGKIYELKLEDEIFNFRLNSIIQLDNVDLSYNPENYSDYSRKFSLLFEFTNKDKRLYFLTKSIPKTNKYLVVQNFDMDNNQIIQESIKLLNCEYANEELKYLILPKSENDTVKASVNHNLIKAWQVKTIKNNPDSTILVEANIEKIECLRK